ncbi:SrfA family protein [Thiocapsa sp.]|uniref:SrfA family protein n=1 Tax=Thiocapsa sp. TaxID=2024551 RepID=UPI002BC7C014|nr:SrfA family protein [Thiocapsa sp.]HSO81301.1 SrfA family protein [Thiocapsa sp.]
MIGPLLRTGTLTDYHPVGAVGHPVYLAAAQLRAALARRLGPDLADSFAIPQRNEDGDTLDWYAPRPGPVVPWSSASPEERLSAQSQLLENRTRIDELACTMQADPDPERQVFARLLAHVFNFPDEGHVYLVDGRPVVSFWGFVRDREAVGSDPLVNLGRFAAPPTEWSLDLTDEPRQDPSPNPAPVARRGLPWWIWFPFLLLALILLLLFLLRGCVPDASTPFAEWVPDWVAEELAPILSEPSAEDPLLVDPSLRDESVVRDVTIDSGQVRDRALFESDLRSDRTTETRAISVTDEGVAVDETSVSGSESTSVTDETDSLYEGAAVLDETIGTDAGEGIEGLPVLPGEELDPDASETTPIEGEVAGADAELPLTEPLPNDLPTDDSAASDPAAVEPDADTGIVEPTADPTLSDPTASDADAAPQEGQAVEDGTGETPPVPGTADAVSPEEGTEPPTGEGDAIPATPGLPGSTAGEAEGAPGAVPGTAPVKGGAAGPSTGPGASKPGATPQALSGLTSGWRTATSLQDPKTGLPIQMEYRTQEGQGQLRLKRHDGSICQSGAAASVKGERLVIDSSGDIRCADGTNFGRPSVECAPGKDGKPDCVGRYPGGGTFSLDVQGAAGE